jgi:hypothetical protein
MEIDSESRVIEEADEDKSQETLNMENLIERDIDKTIKPRNKATIPFPRL